jgi:hypothetical protein
MTIQNKPVRGDASFGKSLILTSNVAALAMIGSCPAPRQAGASRARLVLGYKKVKHFDVM